MRRFNWRKFRRKGAKKLVSKDEKMLESNVNLLKQEVKATGTIEEVSKEVLSEE